MEKFSGDLETIMQYLWSEERVDALMRRDWNQLSTQVNHYADEVNHAIRTFCGLMREERRNEILRYLDELPDDIFDCLLVELARELHFLKENEGVLLH